ncbi:bifunctional methylenetetrahydrofolate dehydrogenase/methenyltetrahydrofolate cyclohydrolase FolD [Sedimenticola hydrogenitrophicus]|uniref:bifunctional methylenetetrahydrofolate dehydrogenase/methenyltetrahydrofolate cyclohydrolase FolD n=1 Tax=Sedimenticola hydrogenitrophicus TaxID=2967975 RepID=UPI0023AEDA40|nr:bifunctional methylenetetrahydrofolate dehydrogenase/methenyltetrahydrofolate cyclohydrolase FolD [Sedimenticola hydrogenitrophicus]
MAHIIDGKTAARTLRTQITQQVAALHSQGITPGLAMVLVGEDPASASYVRSKTRQTGECGMRAFEHGLPQSTTQQQLLQLIERLNDDARVHGILVQLPLPSHIDADAILDSIHPDKDVDGFHPVNVARLAGGTPGIVPCTPLGCLMLLRGVLGDLTGKQALVIGRSQLVGRPMSHLLLSENCTVTTAHSRSRDLAGLCRQADILVVAAGQPELVRGSWIKPGATVIDVGINRLPGENGKPRLVGDVAFREAQEVAGAITPVPGGVGPMTIACLLLNTLLAALRQHQLPIPEWAPQQS